MDDDGFRHEIKRAFQRYEMSPTTALRVTDRGARRTGGAARIRLPRLAVPLVAAAVGAAVLAIAITPPQATFASWHATPSSADVSVVASAQDRCTSSGDDHLSGLKLVGSEQRGEYTMLLFGDGRAYGMCLTGPDIQPMILAGPGTGAVDVPGGPAAAGDGHGQTGSPQAAGVSFIGQPGSDSPLGQSVQAWVVGVTPEVARVVIERDGAEPTIATMGEGVAFAWWPAGTQAAAVAAYDADGNLVQRIPVGGAFISEH